MLLDAARATVAVRNVLGQMRVRQNMQRSATTERKKTTKTQKKATIALVTMKGWKQ